jgi:hypothetical protein
MVERKVDLLRAAMVTGDWRGAVSIASKFSRLGKYKEAIKRGQDAYNNPEFLRQIGRDPEGAKKAAKQALIDGWGAT